MTKKRRKKKVMAKKKISGMRLVGNNPMPGPSMRKTLFLITGFLWGDKRAGLWKGGEVLTTTVDDAMAFSSKAKAAAEARALQQKYKKSYWVVLDVSREVYGI